MAKRNLKKEKALRNEEYAKKFQKSYDDDDFEPRDKTKGGTYGQWCRTKGHAPACSCLYDGTPVQSV